MRIRATVTAAVLLVAATAWAGTVRDLTAAGETVWAVGDRGLLLRSDDGGKTFKPVKVQTDANLQSVAIDGAGVYLIGGRAVSGHPRGVGRGVMLRSNEGGKPGTFENIAPDKAGWLYGASVKGKSVLAFGQARPSSSSGVWETGTDGRIWNAVSTSRTGHLRGGAFRDPFYGYVVGESWRVTSLRNMQEPPIHPELPDYDLDLLDAAFRTDEECWAVGRRGIVLRSRPTGKPWQVVRLPIPAGAARLADFEAICWADKHRGYIAGGLLGVMFRTDDGGDTWKTIDAPGPGQIRTLAAGAGDILLAGGDSGRIWRSDDAGQTWAQTHGPKRTDLLLISAAGDITLYPAAVAHSRAGAGVAHVFATHPTATDAPQAQPLRAAATTAGADATTVLDDFPSIAGRPGSDDLREADVLKLWSRAIDSPAEQAMLLQLTAAIRIHRPRVVTVCSDSPAQRGITAENHLAARLALKSVPLAGGSEGAIHRTLVGAKLAPHKPDRLMEGLSANEKPNLPWTSPDDADGDRPAVAIDAARFPADAPTNIEMLAQQAIWNLPWTGPLDRPAAVTRFACRQSDGRYPLMTTGLTEGRLSLQTVTADRSSLASAAVLRMAVATGRPQTALPQLLGYARSAPKDPLGPDRMLLACLQLRSEGNVPLAAEARKYALSLDASHPLKARLNVLTLSTLVSAEYRALLRNEGNPMLDLRRVLPAIVKRFDTWGEWNAYPAGAYLHANALLASGRQIEGLRKLKSLKPARNDTGDDRPIKDLAALRYALLNPQTVPDLPEYAASARMIRTRGKIDGRLDDACWKRSRTYLLKNSDGAQPAAALGSSVRFARSATHVFVGVQLPDKPGRRWEVRIAADADMDLWTQIELTVDSEGNRSCLLHQRTAPPIKVDLPKSVLLQGRKSNKSVTFEMALPIADLFGVDTGSGVWPVQVTATAFDTGPKSTTVYLRPQDRPSREVEEYGLLVLPTPRARPESAHPGTRRAGKRTAPRSD
ncbi:MAG: YCF48-related protein [Phycisphaerae bacterium]